MNPPGSSDPATAVPQRYGYSLEVGSARRLGWAGRWSAQEG
jgi:hypothetical protein